MNAKQIVSQFKLRNVLAYWSVVASYIMGAAASIVGRFVAVVLVAVANGYGGAVSFANILAPKFLQSTMSANPDMALKYAKAEAYQTAFAGGVVIMILLDFLIVVFALMKPVKLANGHTVELGRAAQRLAVFSSFLGFAGFITESAADFSITASNIMYWVFGGVLALLPAYILHRLAEYMRAADAGVFTLISDYVQEKVMQSVRNDLAPETPKAAPAKSRTTVPPAGVPFDIEGLFKN